MLRKNQLFSYSKTKSLTHPERLEHLDGVWEHGQNWSRHHSPGCSTTKLFLFPPTQVRPKPRDGKTEHLQLLVNRWSDSLVLFLFLTMNVLMQHLVYKLFRVS